MEQEEFDDIIREEAENKADRPIDALNKWRNKDVCVVLKDEEEIKGKLISFDLNINLGLETKDGLRFISGFAVYAIYSAN